VTRASATGGDGDEQYQNENDYQSHSVLW
jgi:hypothetical protein